MLKLKVMAKNSSLLVYKASKDSVISMLGNTLIYIKSVFPIAKKNNDSNQKTCNNIIDRKDVGKMCRSICGIELFIYGDGKYSLV